MTTRPDRTKRAEIRMRKKVVAEILESVPEYIQKVQCDTTLWTHPFKCAVISCRNVFKKYNENARQKFHNFPTDPELRALWYQRCRLQPSFDSNSAKVCTDHFLPDDYERNFKAEMIDSSFKRKLKPSAVPTQLLEGVEVTMVDLINSEQEYNERFNNTDIKMTVDENILLSERFQELIKERQSLHQQSARYDKKINIKIRRIHSIKNELRKLSKMGNTVKEHRNILTKVFSPSQINILLGKKKVFWSNDDLAMAFSLRQIGNKQCYLYLKNILNIPLPSLSCVQRWAASK